MTDYNKASCRACGNALTATKICNHCREPVNWKCSRCSHVDDSIHSHAKIVERRADWIASLEA